MIPAIRLALANARAEGTAGKPIPDTKVILSTVTEHLAQLALPSLRPVHNLTGTVLHTNLGRAALPEEAIKAVAEAARGASNLEYSIDEGNRSDRDEHVEALLSEITGAEAATIVNNNAAAVMLLLNTFALGKSTYIERRAYRN